jgi:hypothetical protein
LAPKGWRDPLALKPDNHHPMDKLDALLSDMLKENTGTHMLDSGGDNGRKWQRNQARDFMKEPAVLSEASDLMDSLMPTVSTFHHLRGALTLDATCNAFNRKPVKDWNGKAYGLSEAGEAWLLKQGFTFGDSWNTYNNDSLLDQVLQGTNLTREGEAEEYPGYVLLQAHGGADVRGGYTDAKLFKCTYSDSGILLGSPEVSGTIDGQEVSTSYDGYRLKLEDGTEPIVKADSVVNLYLSE